MIGVEHVEVLSRARDRNRTTARAYARDEAMLVEWAATQEHGEIDHIDPHHRGGPTSETNGRLRCGFHNRLRHRGADDPPDG